MGYWKVKNSWGELGRSWLRSHRQRERQVWHLQFSVVPDSGGATQTGGDHSLNARAFNFFVLAFDWCRGRLKVRNDTSEQALPFVVLLWLKSFVCCTWPLWRETHWCWDDR